ncbi:MAG: alanine--tRNA ligase [Phycisphaerales bacterium]
MSLSSRAIRKTFLEFFQSKGSGNGAPDGHVIVPSSPVVPVDDPTLMFTNAGMNQFKPIFLGQVEPSSPLAKLRRAADTQKCIRAGGKHNDLEDVGKDTYHHTFFEMLGNWSFGDYFKKEAIEWSWELLTKVYGIPANALYATYFGGDPRFNMAPDEETRQLWLQYLPADRVIPGNMKDNFWMMGDTGPCGPCTEIHVDRLAALGQSDRNAASIVNMGDPDVLEIWNNVFIQFNSEYPAEGAAALDQWDRAPEAQRTETGYKSRAEIEAKYRKLITLPAKHVDTGMGLERLVSVLQNVRSNYDTDLFAPIFLAIERATGAREYRGMLGAKDVGNIDTAYRVIADHIRCLTFAITDGAVPSNVGRGYVLRRILRRAVRYGRQMLGAKGGFFAGLVPIVVEHMSDAFPELKRDPAKVEAIIREEEESFGRTLDRGIRLFNEFVANQVGMEFCKSNPECEQFLGIESDNLGRTNTYAVSFVPKGGGNRKRTITSDVEQALIKGAKLTISGADAFKLYDTFGFPIDLTELMARERGIAVDMPGYEAEKKKAEDLSRASEKKDAEKTITLDGDAVARLMRLGIETTDDHCKFDMKAQKAHVKAIWNGTSLDEAAGPVFNHKTRVGIVLDKTCFYAAMGGQECDVGEIEVIGETKSSVRDHHEGGRFKVESVASFGGYVLHIGVVTHGELRVGDTVAVNVDKNRRNSTAANHTATHLANFALRAVLGDGVDQKGSLVAADRMRFDFSHGQPVSPEELGKVESIVRDQIKHDLTVYAQAAPLMSARGINGLRAVFGEAYPDPVRVVSIGQPVADLMESAQNPGWREISIEFCGGTHVQTTSQIGAFALVSEEAVAKGVRRIVALSGKPAEAAIHAADGAEAKIRSVGLLSDSALVNEIPGLLKVLDDAVMPTARKTALRNSISALQERAKNAAKAASAGRQTEAVREAKVLAESAQLANQHVIVGSIEAGDDRNALNAAVAVVKDANPRAAIMLFSIDHPTAKVTINALVPEPLIQKGLRAGDWLREAAAVVGGKGGGKPDSAQGGGTDASKIKEAILAARAAAHRVVH